jgi:hypothetical protein
MKRKIKGLAEETQKQIKRLEETQKLLEMAQKEEQEKIGSVTAEINSLCEENDFFCGIILTTEDLMSVIRLAIDSKEPVKIPFRIYMNEEVKEK